VGVAAPGTRRPRSRPPRPPPTARTATAEQILDLAEMLIQTRSYSAFSYQDIADALGITKASIHYHFASKAALGAAVVDRYVGRIEAAMTAMDRNDATSSMAMLEFYMTPYVAFADTPDRVCLCGALAGELMTLPPEIRARVERFFRSHQAWLAGILARGAKRKEFALAAPPAQMAHLMLGALQGALLVKRTTGDSAQMNDVVKVLKAQLRGGRRAASDSR
jgi:TetR/AcrR family transcriptional repressor of nem operon